MVAAEEAVIVTMLPVGAVVGAVYIICPPLAVCAGDRLKLPHAPGLPQVAVQFTPFLFVTGVTVAASGADAPPLSVAGSDDVDDIVTVTGAAVTTVAVPVADFVGSVVDVAVTVIVPPTGTVEVFVKVAAPPLAVWVEIDPQFVVPQLNVQSTPAASASLETIAVR